GDMLLDFGALAVVIQNKLFFRRMGHFMSPVVPMRGAVSEPREKCYVSSRCPKAPATTRFLQSTALQNGAARTPCAPAGSTGPASPRPCAALRRQIKGGPDPACRSRRHAPRSRFLRPAQRIPPAASADGAS